VLTESGDTLRALDDAPVAAPDPDSTLPVVEPVNAVPRFGLK